MLEGPLTHSVIGAFYEVHRELGFGFREHIYALALERTLIARGHKVEREVVVMVHFSGAPLASQALDMIVDEKLVLETKATEHLHPGARRQLFSYLSATNLELGLLLHFGREAKFYRVICENHLKRHGRDAPRSPHEVSAPAPDPPLP
jgi:GxxExxY protein